MAEISGATIDFTDYSAPGTPRVLNVPASHGDASAQDLWDTLSSEAAKIDNLIYRKLIDRPKGGGKSLLKAGKFTGIILPMNNIQVQFEPSTVKLETGTVTTGDATGRVLTDNLATFQTNLIERGDLALNTADGSHATVLRVISETQLVTTQLTGGVDNQWDNTDAYEIFDHVKRNVVDGDVIAQDHLEAALDPLLTSFGVDSTVELSTSPALAEKTGVPERATAWPNFAFNLVLSSDHASPATGKAATITVRLCKDDGAWAVIPRTITEVGQGQYRIDLTAADMDFETGTLMFSEPDVDPIKITIRTAGA